MNPRKQATLIGVSEGNLHLKSPVFKPRPGWGGRLGKLLNHVRDEHLYTALFAVMALLLAGYSVMQVLHESRARRMAAELEVTPTAQSEKITETARAGEGISHLAGRAVAEYLALNPDTPQPTAVEMIWAVYLLSQNRITGSLNAGQDVDFTAGQVGQALEQARNLSPTQRQNLSKYVR